jgi:hypothetical protein
MDRLAQTEGPWTPLLWFRDDDGKTRMALGYHLDGEKYTGPTIHIFEKDGKVGWRAP